MKTETVALFVDVQNIYYTTRDIFQKHFDYNRFWQKATTGRKVIAAIAYAIDRKDEKQQQFQNILRGIGFTVKLKPFINRSDGSAKGDWDVGLTIDMLELAATVDRVILLSGDGDFSILLDKVKTAYHVTTEVYGVRQLTANALISSADAFTSIDVALLR